MCFNPNRLPDGTEVACRNCKRCRYNYTKDWAGRLIAESKTSRFSVFVTLTYGRDEYGDSDHLNAAVLTYSDVQKWLKKIRNTVGKFKYFVAGEYGTKRGRAHWHVCLFAEKSFWEQNGFKMGRRYMDRHWEHGWTQVDPFRLEHATYCTAYLYKNEGLSDSMHQMSRKPPLGHEWFQALADRHVKDGIAPQDLFYYHPESRKKNGELVQYKMCGVTAENFLEYFVQRWQRVYGKSEMDYYDVRFHRVFFAGKGARYIPHSPVVEEYLDRRMRMWVERAKTWEAHWAYVDYKRDKERRYEQEKKDKERKDDCPCASCKARRARTSGAERCA